MTTLKLGNDDEHGNSVFDVWIKSLPLLYAINDDSLKALSSVGFDQEPISASYEDALARLKDIFVREELAYGKFMPVLGLYLVLGGYKAAIKASIRTGIFVLLKVIGAHRCAIVSALPLWPHTSKSLKFSTDHKCQLWPGSDFEHKVEANFLL